MRDTGLPTYIFTFCSSCLAWLGEQQNLMFLSLAIGVITAILNAVARFKESRAKRRELEKLNELHELEIRHKKELHEIELAKLRSGLEDEKS
ncbi:hypothetical protein A6B44_05055 [Pasteurella skyensis]|nr:hypothetical protein [Pasteurella skyensis]QLB23678.1 hypothetical protein A6B44_05055 [Pasteurella skyensis]